MNLTTAQVLGQYRRELIAEGFDPETIAGLVRMAQQTILRRDEGIDIRVQSCCNKHASCAP